MRLLANYELYDTDSAVRTRFFEGALTRAWEQYLTHEWSAPAPDAATALGDAGWLVRTASRSPDIGRTVTLAEGADHLVLLTVRRGDVEAEVAAESAAAAEKARIALTELFPPVARVEGRVDVTLCTWHGRVSRVTRSVRVPSWDAVRDNYTAAARRGFEALLGHDFSDQSGKLALWHGAPGTGKTYAVRALLDAWRDDVEFHYVTDPELFFSTSSEYMLSLALPAGDGDGRRLLVIEDAAEMLSVDARRKVGHALGRLLNLCDGLVGQGLDLLILITTNEPLGQLHPAITRPGRCASEVEFGPLDGEETARWLATHGVPRSRIRRQPMTLAEMYGVLRGHEPAPGRHVGF